MRYVNDLQMIEPDAISVDAEKATRKINAAFEAAKVRAAAWDVRPIEASDDAGAIFRPCVRRWAR